MPIDQPNPFDNVNLYSPEFRELLNEIAEAASAFLGMTLGPGLVGQIGPDGASIATLDETGGGSGSSGLFPVLVRKDGGVEGSKTTRCTFTYTVWDISGKELGTGMSPMKNRTLLGRYVPPTIGDFNTIGTGYYHPDGRFFLYDANEVQGTNAC